MLEIALEAAQPLLQHDDGLGIRKVERIPGFLYHVHNESIRFILL
jgi:hypothetical protein